MQYTYGYLKLFKDLVMNLFSIKAMMKIFVPLLFFLCVIHSVHCQSRCTVFDYYERMERVIDCDCGGVFIGEDNDDHYCCVSNIDTSCDKTFQTLKCSYGTRMSDFQSCNGYCIDWFNCKILNLIKEACKFRV